MTGVRFHDPAWLALAAAAIPMAVVGLLWFRSMLRVRRWACGALRVLLFVALAAALAGATLTRSVDRLAVIAVIDLSESVRRLFDPGRDGAGRPVTLTERIGGFLEEAQAGPAAAGGDAAGQRLRRADDLSAVVVYDAAAQVVSPLEARAPAPFIPRTEGGSGLLEAAAAPGVDGTDSAAGLRIAGAMAVPDSNTRVVLFTDGNDTSGDAVREAARLNAGRIRADGEGAGSGVRGGWGGRGEGIRVDVVPLVYTVRSEVVVESLEAPSSVPAESTVMLRVTLASSAAVAGELRVAREGQPIDASPGEPGLGRRVLLQPGRSVVRIPVRLPAGRVHRFVAEFVPDDAAADAIASNNAAQAVTLAPGRSSVLLVSGAGIDSATGSATGGDTGALSRTLAAEGFEVDALPASSVVGDPLWLQRYDLVALENVPADALGEGVAGALARYVTEQGGGLVMIGGPDSFGAGGWKGTEIEPILPVRLDLPERLVSPAAAVVIVIDCSGSMGFRVAGGRGGGVRRSKQAIANEGAAIAVKSLDKTDLVGVVIFNERARSLITLQPNAAPDRSAETIRGIEPDGGTNLPPALEMAYAQLRGVKADTKHIIVLSDGRSQGTEKLPAQVDLIRAAGIRLSTIAVGDEADVRTMSLLAARGDGTYYRVIDPNLLPRIFLKAVRVVRTPLIREQAFKPLVLSTGSPIVEGLDQEAIPELKGLVLTQARPASEQTVTYAMATPTGEPLLAHWNAGIGRVAAFTSDAHHWASAWLSWPGYPRMWTQIVRNIARPQADRSQELMVDVEGDELVVTAMLRGEAGEMLDGVDLAGIAHGPGGRRVPVRPAQVGPGEYRSRVPVGTEPGSWVVTLSPRIGRQVLPPLIGGAARAGGAEFRRLETDTEHLHRIAEAGGGRVYSLDRPGEVGLFDRAGIVPAVARSPIWRWLVIAGIALFLLDVASRRVAWDRFVGDRENRRRERAAATAERAVTTMERLRRAEQQGQAVASQAEGPAKLSTEDARELVRQQAERRRLAREAARGGRSPGSEQAEPSDGHPDAGERPASGLMEAKRRARRKIEGDQDTGENA